MIDDDDSSNLHHVHESEHLHATTHAQGFAQAPDSDSVWPQLQDDPVEMSALHGTHKAEPHKRRFQADAASVVPQTGGGKKILRLAGMGMLVAMGWMGYSFYQNFNATLPQIADQTKAPLPSALDVAELPAHSDIPVASMPPVAGVSAPAPVPIPVPVAVVGTGAEPAAAAVAALAPVSAPSSIAADSVASGVQDQASSAVVKAATVADTAATPSDMAKVNTRLDDLGQQISALTQALLASGAKVVKGGNGTLSNASGDAMASTSQPHFAGQHRAQRSVKLAKAMPIAAPAVAVATAIDAQLLSVDLWDGRPSVVLGTNQPGDKRMRVLQPGESQSGIGLQSADVAGQTATFVVDGKTVTLSKSN